MSPDPDVQPSPIEHLFDVARLDVGGVADMGDIETDGVAPEELQGHLLNRRAAGKVLPHGIRMRGPVLAHQDVAGREAERRRTGVLLILLVRLVEHDEGLLVHTENRHAFVDFLREIDDLELVVPGAHAAPPCRQADGADGCRRTGEVRAASVQDAVARGTLVDAAACRRSVVQVRAIPMGIRLRWWLTDVGDEVITAASSAGRRRCRAAAPPTPSGWGSRRPR